MVLILILIPAVIGGVAFLLPNDLAAPCCW